MLAIFEKNVAKTPEALQSPENGSVCALKDGFLQNHFSSIYPGVVTNLGFPVSWLSRPTNRTLFFPVVDNMFCIFLGHIEKIPFLKQQYGLNKTATEMSIVIEAYRTLRDRGRGPYSVDQVVRDFQGKFAFMLFDCSTKNVFLAADVDGSVPIFWGTDAEGNLVVSDDVEIVKKGCGCFFTPSGGLRSYEHPLNELKPVPRVDSSGEVCDVTFLKWIPRSRKKPQCLELEVSRIGLNISEV